MKLCLFLLSALLVFTVFPVASQETDSPAENEIFVITDFEFNITGRTRPFALINEGELRQGEVIRGRENLAAYIRDRTQRLVNQRVLRDTVAITYSIGEQNEDGSFPVILIIAVEDSWNIIALPYPRYTDNDGFSLTIRARDYNFFGTMAPLRIDIGYTFNQYRESSFLFEVYSSTPFRAFGYTWNFRFDNLFWYRPDADEPFFFQNVTGLSMELPLRITTFTFGFEQSFTLNEENPSWYWKGPNYGEQFQSGLFPSTRLFANLRVPLGIEVSRFGEMTYNAGFSATFNHEFPVAGWELREFRRGPFLRFNHSLGFGRIDWRENFRDGVSVSIHNAFNYDFFRHRNNRNPLSASVSIGATGHFVISEFFGISARLQYRYWYQHEPMYHDRAGDFLRGIIDNAMNADHMLSLNMDFPFRVFRFVPSQWLNNRRLSFFDLEFHLSPIFDMALYRSDPQAGNLMVAVTGGAELIIFSGFMRNLYARFSLGGNIRELFRTGELPSGNNREFSFTLGHFF